MVWCGHYALADVSTIMGHATVTCMVLTFDVVVVLMCYVIFVIGDEACGLKRETLGEMELEDGRRCYG